jgi:hypothetical protein
MGRRRKTPTLKQQLDAIVIKIPIDLQTITAALLLTQQIIELARVVKIPLKVEKTATVEIPTLTPAVVEQAAAEIQQAPPTENPPAKEGG